MRRLIQYGTTLVHLSGCIAPAIVDLLCPYVDRSCCSRDCDEWRVVCGLAPSRSPARRYTDRSPQLQAGPQVEVLEGRVCLQKPRRFVEASGIYVVFFFQAEDGIRDVAVTGVQTCALPI